MIEVRVLGPLEVRRDNRALPIRGIQARIILAVLALADGAMVEVHRLADALWTDDPPLDPRHALETVIHRLRKAIGSDCILTGPSAYAAKIDATDADKFARGVEEASLQLGAGDVQAAERTLLEAMSLWRGEVLSDLPDLPALTGARRRLSSLREQARRHRVQAMVDSGRHQQALPELEALVAAQPYDEEARSMLMLALYRSGRQADALGEYHDYRSRVDTELGLEPAPLLNRRYEEILRQDSALELATPIGTSSDVPKPRTSFIGRARELARLQDLVERERLVTLIGPGGAGKSRLALQLMQRSAERPTWYVAVDALTDQASMDAAIAHAVGIRVTGGRGAAQSLREALSMRDGLLVLDGCDHQIAAARHTIGGLLDAARGLRILATSRARLRVRGEAAVTVPPMDVPDERTAGADAMRSDALRLFVDRARAARPSLRLQRSDIRHMLRICRAVDGLPLGIEIAAGLTRAMSISDIAARTDQLLDTDHITAKEGARRHASLRAAIAWSTDLLSAGSRELLGRLSVFAGPFRLESAEEVCSTDDMRAPAVVETIADLVDRSLLSVSEADNLVRYRMLDTVRSLAREDLLSDAELVELRQRHARYFTARAEPPSVTASDPATAGWVRRVASELAEYRDIFAAARQPSRDRTSGLRLATHLGRVWEWTGQAEEGIATLCSLLDRTDGVHPTLVSEAESWIAYFAWRLGDMPTAESAVRNALNVLATDGDVGQRAAALGMASLVARGSGKPDLAEQYALDSEELWARLGDSWALARTRVLAGRAALAGGRLAEAEEHLDLARDQYTRLGPGRGSGWVATGLGMIRSEQGQFEEAVALGREALVEARRMDDRDTELEALDLLAAAESSLGREDDASRTRRAARELRQAIDHRRLTDEGVSESRS